MKVSHEVSSASSGGSIKKNKKARGASIIPVVKSVDFFTALKANLHIFSFYGIQIRSFFLETLTSIVDMSHLQRIFNTLKLFKLQIHE